MVFILLITGLEGIFMGLELSMYQVLLTTIFKNCFREICPRLKRPDMERKRSGKGEKVFFTFTISNND